MSLAKKDPRISAYFVNKCLCFFLWFLHMWAGLIKKAKEGGFDVIQSYVFWNGHEPEPGKVSVAFCIIDNCCSN